jgi:hypothetical protein
MLLVGARLLALEELSGFLILAAVEAQRKSKNLATLAVVALCALTLLLCAAGLLTDPEQREEPFRAA